MLKDNLIPVTGKLVTAWMPALENSLGKDVVAGMSDSKKKLLVAMAAYNFSELSGIGLESYMNQVESGEIALETDFSYVNANNSGTAAPVLNPIAGANNGLTSQPGSSGSGDRQFLVGICIAIAAKTIGLELVQTVPATSQNVTIKFLNVVYNGGKLDDPANSDVHVVTLSFPKATALSSLAFTVGTTYVVGHPTPASGDAATAYEFLELKYVKKSRKGSHSFIFEIMNAFTATNTALALTNVAYVGVKPAIASVIADGKFYSINGDMDTLSAELSVSSVENTKAVEDYVPTQTTKGLKRTLTRSEADAGTDRSMELELKSEAYTIGNRVFTGQVARLQYKYLVEQGIDALAYLTAAMKNEVSQEINYQIVSACRAYGIQNALEYEAQGTSFNTYIGPKTVNDIAFNAIPYATQLFDPEYNAVASQFSAVKNLMQTMQYETVASIGTYLCMLISQASYMIGTDSRYGEADAVVVSAALAGYLAASTQYTKLADKDADMSAGTGAKLSGYVGGIKVYVDVQTPANSPFVTVIRTNQNVKVDMPGIEGDTVLVPGLAYLMKDLISSTDLVPEGTGGKKIIMDSETDLIAVGNRPQAGYLTFAFYVQLPGLAK